MSHTEISGVIGSVALVFCALLVIIRYRSGRLKGRGLILVSIGLGLWAIGLALSFTGI
jgi:hypothetical protein